MQPKISSLSKSPTHTLIKSNENQLQLLEGLGVEGDAHAGKTVKHRSRVAKDPTQPNLRQVHLIHQELHKELQGKGFQIEAGQMGENITTKGVDLLNLPTGTILELGQEARIKITGLRNPCYQLDSLQKGLMKAVLDKDAAGNLVRKSGVMAIVLQSGIIKVDDQIKVILPPEPHVKLEKV